MVEALKVVVWPNENMRVTGGPEVRAGEGGGGRVVRVPHEDTDCAFRR